MERKLAKAIIEIVIYSFGFITSYYVIKPEPTNTLDFISWIILSVIIIAIELAALAATTANDR
jgi:hypothetical protein